MALAYRENRVVKIHSSCLCLFHVFGLVLIFFGYIIVYQGLMNHGFQLKSDAEGVVYTQVRGAARIGGLILDDGDYVIPPKENGAFTIPTSLLVTRQFNNRTCGQAVSVEGERCTDDTDCPAGEGDYAGNGINTGKCLLNATGQKNATGVCELEAWCPVQNPDDLDNRINITSANFIVYVRSEVSFPDIKEHATNIPQALRDDNEKFRTCRYDPENAVNRNCPMFTPKQIMSLAGYDIEDPIIVVYGAVIKMTVNWDCCFGRTCKSFSAFWYTGEECLPTYKFQRMDMSRNITRRGGFNIKKSEYPYQTSGPPLPMERILYRLFGVRVIVSIEGEAREYGHSQVMLSIFSGWSFFGLMAVVITALLGLHHCFKDCGSCWRPLDSPRSEEERKDDKVDEINFFCTFTCDAFRKCCCARFGHRNASYNRELGEGETDNEQELRGVDVEEPSLYQERVTMAERLNQMEARQSQLEDQLRALQV